MDCESKKGGKQGYPLPDFSRFGFSDNPDHNDTGISGIDTLDPTGKTAQTIRESFQDEEMAPHQMTAMAYWGRGKLAASLDKTIRLQLDL